jgi:putative membrane-bound dehydrogenase-like protein
MKQFFLIAALALIGTAGAAENDAKAQAAAISAQETAVGVEAPEGFVVDVIASEPDIVQPIALAWDHQGRLYVAECRTYADRTLNYDLTESDRIVVLEDRDADGSFETRTVFAEGLQRLTGIEVGFGGVWALTSPTMVFIPDADGDLVPDGPSVTRLDGFDLKYTRHTIANGLKWGPDGWLYGRQGIVAVSEIGPPGASKEERLSIDTGIWRFHPQTNQIEAWTRGGTNPWGHDWNEEGELFYINTVIGHFWHGIPGAYTKRMFGQHQRPYLYRLIDMHADHWHFDIDGAWQKTREDPDAEDAFGGGHAHTGLMIYQADKWPEEYHGDAYTLNFHGRRINRESLHREGSGYVAKHEADLVKFPDRWFRGIDLAQGPDGDVYVLDWSDTGECHDHDGIHRESGRIYRVRYGEAASGLVKLPQTFEELDAWLRHPNVWYARHARLLVQEKAAEETLPQDWQFELLKKSSGGAADIEAIRYRQAFYNSLTGGPTTIAGGSDSSEALRAHTIRFLRNSDTAVANHELHSEKWAPDLERMAQEDSARIRLGLCSLLPSLAVGRQLTVAEALIAHGEDSDDHNYPLMLWYAIEPIIGRADEADVSRLLKACQIPELRRFIIRRIGEDYDENRALISKLILAQPEHAAGHLAGLADSLQGIPKTDPLPDWEKISSLAKDDPIVDQLGAVFGDGRSLDSLFAIADNEDADPNARRQAVKHLGTSDFPELKSHLLRWIVDDQLSGACARALAQYPDDDAGKAIVQRLVFMKLDERAAAVDVLVSRASWAKFLLDRIASKALGPDIISTVHARQIAQFGDEALSEQLGELWGEVNVSGDDPAAAALDKKLRNFITRETLQAADMSAGRLIYSQRCASCHQLYGVGGQIGPDLTGSGRHDLAYLVENILYPSAVVPAAYKMAVMKMNDGRTLSGVILASSEKRVSLRTVGAVEPMYLSPDEIESTEILNQSLMPAGLINDLDDVQLRDLIGYLMGDHQAPLKE